MKPWLKAACIAGLIAQASAAFAVTGMKYISTAGDYIGGGISQTFEPPNATITAQGSVTHAAVAVNDPNNWWYIDFASPADSTLAKGSYPDAARYPFQSPRGAGLSMYGNGRGCNTLRGWFRIREYEVGNDGVVTKLAADFLQNCEVSGPPLYGTVRINSDFPLAVPDVVAVAGADFDVMAGEKAKLDGGQSFARKSRHLSYQWTQVDGPAVVLDRPTSAHPSFTAPAVDKKGASLRFLLQVTDTDGKTSTDHVIVLVNSPLARTTQVSFHGDSGDYITQGQSYRYDTHNASITFSRNYDGGVSAWIEGDAWWTFDAASPTGTQFGPGTYRHAQRFPFQDEKSPGLDLSGDGRGCNTLTGKFEVYQAKFDDLGNPVKLDMSFVQHCEGGTAAAHGDVLLNAVPHQVLSKRLREARLRYGAR